MSSGFLADKFQAAQYEARTARVSLPILADFFPEGEEPAFTVRGLTASELNKAIEAGMRRKAIDAVAQAIATQKEEIAGVRAALGLSKETPGEIAKRLEMLVLGAVEPVVSHATAAKLAEIAPVEFYELTNRITELTAQGGSRVKRQPSSQATPD